MPDDEFSRLLQEALRQCRTIGRQRGRMVMHHHLAAHVEIEGRRLVNFCSNDYLGLSHHPKIAQSMAQATAEHGSGAGASPLISGHSPAHESAERAIAQWKGTERALLLPSGYQANHAAVQALAGAADAGGRRVRFILDKLSHASLIDAVRSTEQPFRVFPHNDLAKLARLLEDADKDVLQVVVTESIFSMDGDATPLVELAALKRKSNFVLLLDEAHASGVYGSGGAGYASEVGVSDAVDVSIVTFSKALGVAGGAICASEAFCDAVVNFGRAYIYSTAASPAIAGAVEAAIRVMHDEPERQRRVRELARLVRAALMERGIAMPRGDSPIIPILLGEERLASEAANRMQSDGLLVLPIRPPTVAKGTSRLRVTVSSAHTDDEVDQLVAALLKLRL